MFVSAVLLVLHGQAMVFLHALHFVRPFLANLIVEVMPRTHDIYELLPDDLTQVHEEVKRQLYEQMRKANRPLMLYGMITVVSALLDLIGLLINMITLDKDNTYALYYGILAWIFLGMIYSGFDLYAYYWYYTLRFSVPKVILDNLRELMKNGYEYLRLLLLTYFGRNEPVNGP